MRYKEEEDMRQVLELSLRLVNDGKGSYSGSKVISDRVREGKEKE